MLRLLALMPKHVSNVPGGLLGPEIARVEGRPSWPSGVPAEAASGRAAHHARTHAACSSRMHRQLRLKPDHDMACMVDRPAVCIHL